MEEIFKKEYKIYKEKFKNTQSYNFSYGKYMYFVLTGVLYSDIYDNLVDIFNKYFKDNYIEVTEGPGRDLLESTDIVSRVNMVGVEKLEQLMIGNFDIE